MYPPRWKRNRCIHIRCEHRCGKIPARHPPGPPPPARLRRLAAQLRDLREARGLTQEDVARQTGKDRSTLYRLETAQQRPQRATLIQLLDLYQAGEPRRGELLTLLREASQRGWMQHRRTDRPGVDRTS